MDGPAGPTAHSLPSDPSGPPADRGGRPHFRGGAERFRRRWRRWTIRHELALLALVTLLPFTVLGGYWTVEDYRAEQGRIQDRALQLAREVSAEVDQFVADSGALVEALARVPSIKRGEQPQADHLLAQLAERSAAYESLFVADVDGRLLAASGPDVVPPTAQQAYVGQALDAGGTVVSSPILRRATGRHVFVVATPLWDEAGAPVGVVALSVNLLRLQESLRRAQLPDNSSVLVVDRLGRVVARRTEPEQWVGRSALGSPIVRDALRLRQGVSEGAFVDGVRRLSGFHAAARVPWEVIVGIPSEGVYGALRRELVRALTRLMLAGAVAALAAWVLSRRLTQPIGALDAAAKAYAAGDLSQRGRPRGPEELVALGAAMNAMAAALQERIAELRESRLRERAAGERALEDLRRLHSEFIAVAAHELRTPVAAAKSYAELLLRDAALPPETRRHALTRMNAVCERLTRLMRSLLGASRIQAGRLEVRRQPVDLAALVRRVADEFAAATPTHEIAVVLPQQDPAVALADAERVEDVLVNLLANAAKYAREGTLIRVAVAPSRSGVEVRVRDEGPGIPEDEQAAVFERFRRGRGTAASGVGLGLHIAQTYITAMGGQIGVRSLPDQGATFWFRLPVASGAPAAALAAEPGHAAVRT